jgi:hypothetical protein
LSYRVQTTYGLVASTLKQAQLNQIERPGIRALLNKLGYNLNIPREIIGEALCTRGEKNVIITNLHWHRFDVNVRDALLIRRSPKVETHQFLA